MRAGLTNSKSLPAAGVILVDFGKVTFANLEIIPPPGAKPFRVHFGEAMKNGRLDLSLPEGMAAEVDIPAPAGSAAVTVGGKPVEARREGSRWILAEPVSGRVTVMAR